MRPTNISKNIKNFVRDGCVTDEVRCVYPAFLATSLAAEPSLIDWLVDFFKNCGISEVSEKYYSGSFSLIFEPLQEETKNADLLRMEIKIPGVDYDCTSGNVIKPSQVLLNDERFHICWIPRARIVTEEEEFIGNKSQVRRLILSLARQGYLFWDPTPLNVGFVGCSEELLVTDRNALVKYSLRDLTYTRGVSNKPCQFKFSSRFEELNAKYNFVTPEELGKAFEISARGGEWSYKHTDLSARLR